MEVQFKNVKGTINTGHPATGENDFTDEDFRYELMWTGGFHKPAKESLKELKELGLIVKDETPTIRKFPIDINVNDGTGARYWIEKRNFRTLGQMEQEIGISSQAVMEAWGYGRPLKPLNVIYDCGLCNFACGSEIGLELHMSKAHGSGETDKSEGITGTSDVRATSKDTGKKVEGVTTSVNQSVAGTRK